MIDLDDTIVACSSPPGVGAISLIRVSSPDISFLAEYFSLDEFKANEAKVTEIELKKGLKEKCVLTLFRKPNSFTGEDILEVSCHGNPLIANLLVSYFVSKGCREAGPGEFSLRSFMNNKLTLLEAEAIDDLINAETEEQLLASSRSLKGAFDSRIDFVIEKLKDLRIYVESNIDFSDDEIINDFDGVTLVSASSRDKDIQSQLKKVKNKTEMSVLVGKTIAKKAKSNKIGSVVLDRNGSPYHGRVKALADSARTAGLKF